MIQSIKKKPTRPRRNFDESFKREAVRAWIDSDKGPTDIAKELGLTPDHLYKQDESEPSNLWLSMLKHVQGPVDSFADGDEPLAEMFG